MYRLNTKYTWLDHSVSMTHLNIFSVVHPSTILTKVLWSDLYDTSSWSFSFKTWFCVSVSISPLLNIDGETGANLCFKTVSNVVCPVARNLIMQTYAASASYTLISPVFIPFLPDNIIFTLTTATTIPWKPVGSFLQKYFNCNIPKDTASSTLTFLSLLIFSHMH